jgi:hypothetical protein
VLLSKKEYVSRNFISEIETRIYSKSHFENTLWVQTSPLTIREEKLSLLKEVVSPVTKYWGIKLSERNLSIKCKCIRKEYF